MSVRSVPSLGRSLEVDGRAVAAGGIQLTITTVEDWEDTDPMSEWSGDTGDFDIVTSPAGAIANGSNAIRKTQNGAFSNITSHAAGLNAYAGYGDIHRIYVYANQLDGRVIWRWGENAGDEFNVRVRFGTDVLSLYHVTTQLAENTSVGLAADTLYYVEITHDDGTLGGSDGDISVTLHKASDDSLVSDLGTVNHTGNQGTQDYHELSMDQMDSAGDDLFHDWAHIRE